MKVNELRIGNLVRIDRGIGKICAIYDPKFEDWQCGLGLPVSVSVNESYYDCTEEEIEGVGITPGYLNLMGFMNNLINMRIYTKGEFSIASVENYFEVFLAGNIVKIDFVHELQNLYYALFKKELEENM